MTDLGDDVTASSPRRPPAAPAGWATVTPLSTRPRAASPRPEAPRPPIEGTLALDAAAYQPVASRPVDKRPEGPALRLVEDGEHGDEVKRWAARFAQAAVEVLGGDRPLSQLLRWTSPQVYLEIDHRLTILNRSTDAGRRLRTVRPQVRSVHVCRPTPRSAEVSVHVRHGKRSRAIAARLEVQSGRWQCTALELG
jgi:hypothetical protein